jgi:hypothetical protein
MACIICKKSGYTTLRKYEAPDIYEKYVGIENVKRSWRQCRSCMFQYQVREYPLADLEVIYKKGYRDKKFRGMNIRQAYNKVSSLPKDKSESWQRATWFKQNCNGANKILDIGSGLGIFPKHLIDLGFKVDCTEENLHSIRWIKNVLKLECYNQIPKVLDYDLISLVHVLEHIEKPGEFIDSLSGIRLFIEVPDASFLLHLEDDHDDLNSCHLWGFDFHTLDLLLQKSGYYIYAAKRFHYPERNLRRLAVLAKCN